MNAIPVLYEDCSKITRTGAIGSKLLDIQYTIFMATTGYLWSFSSENFMYLAWICVELCFVEDTHHRCPWARQWRHVHIAFHSATIPLMSSQITHSQAKETNAGVALTTRLFILNI